jgi:hypothetical protein
MSEITTRIEQYHKTGVGWPELKAWLLDHKYVVAKRYADPQPGPTDERDWDYLEVDGSWDEVKMARVRKLLTRAEYMELVQAFADRRAASVAKAAKEQ